jgi:hypothetical protein
MKVFHPKLYQSSFSASFLPISATTFTHNIDELGDMHERHAHQTVHLQFPHHISPAHLEVHEEGEDLHQMAEKA